MIRRWADEVALVLGGGAGIGRAVALALAARGVRVVVMGESERGVAEVVGEIAAGGGKARHAVGRIADLEHLRAAAGKAHAAFGGLDLLVAPFDTPTLDAAAALLGVGGTLVVVGGPIDPARYPTLVCLALEAPDGTDPSVLAEQVVQLCSTLHA